MRNCVLCAIVLLLWGYSAAHADALFPPAHPFQDVPVYDSAYTDMARLQHDSLLTLYWAGKFNGKTPQVRYAFAVALSEALNRLPLPSELAASHSKLSSRDIAVLKRLTNEFSPELNLLGVHAAVIQQNLAALRLAVFSLTRKPVPHISGLSSLLQPAGGKLGNPFTGVLIAPSASAGASSGRAAELYTDTQAVSGYSILPSLLIPASADAPNARGIQISLPISGASQLKLSLHHSYGTAFAPGLSASSTELGTDFTLSPLRHFSLGAGAVQRRVESSMPGLPVLGSDALRVHVSYNSSAASATLGYQMLRLPETIGILPPSGMQGPYMRFQLNIGPHFRSYLGGDMLQYSSSDSSALPGNIYTGRAGIRWEPNNLLSLSADYQGILYDMAGISAGGHAPIEQIITLGAGLHLSSNAILRMVYSVNSQPGPLTSTSAAPSAFSTQLSIHF